MCLGMKTHFKTFAYLLLMTALGMYVLYSLAAYDSSYRIQHSTVNLIYMKDELPPKYRNGITHLHGRHVRDIWLQPVKPEALPINFQPDLQVTEVDLLLNLLRKFRMMANTEGWRYFLMGSSLLGAYRHQGLVPWEGQLVIAMDVKDKSSLQDQTSRLIPNYQLYEVKHNFSTTSMKFYSYYSDKVQGEEYRYPYIEINFYQEHKNHIVMNNGPINYETKHMLPKSWIFPMQHSPIWNIYVPVPHKIKEVLEYTWDLKICQSKTFDPRTGKVLTKGMSNQVLCTSLWDQFPFVLYHKLNNSSKRFHQVLWKHAEFITAV